jgi:hypothetical protein
VTRSRTALTDELHGKLREHFTAEDAENAEECRALIRNSNALNDPNLSAFSASSAVNGFYVF